MQCVHPIGGNRPLYADGLSLLESLVTLTLIAMLTALTGGTLSTLASWRGLSAIQVLASDLEEARALAIAEQETVWLAFAGDGAGPHAFHGYIRCRALLGADGKNLLQPVGDWRHLPSGQIFTAAAPASPEAGRNLLTSAAALQPVQLAGTRLLLPCLAFGTLGQVLHPAQGRPLLALTEGEGHDGRPRARQNPGAEACRWLVVQRHTGNLLLLP